MRVGAGRLCLVVNLERTPKEFLIAQELHKCRVILCTTADEIDSFATRGTVFDILATIVEPALIFFGPNVVDLSHQPLSRAVFFRFRDIDKQRLIRGACECTEYVEEVVSAGWT